ncbi:hypothetical protein QT06_C0001G0974 [archaeon GW2011_AR15]|nr:hypothetical protein QT06_C0001G0974 [archaeon GW2011_AR15]
MEKQTELKRYFDIRPFVFETSILNILKRFKVEAFPYEHN